MKKEYCIAVCLFLMCIGLLPLSAQSGKNTASFGVFSDTHDWYMDSMSWQKAIPRKFSIYGGISENTLNIGFAANIYGFYVAGSYSEFITAYGYAGNTLTDETVNILLGFDRWSVHLRYFDQNFTGGKGTAAPSLFVSMALPISESILKIRAGVDCAFKYSAGNILDIIQPSMGIHIQYDWISSSAAIKYTAMPTFAGTHNTTDVSVIPVLHQFGGWYSHTWDLSSDLLLALTVKASSSINVNRLSGEYDFLVQLPIALVYNLIPKKCDIQTAMQIGMYYASFDYPEVGGIGGNMKGCVPSIGIAFGFSLYMTPHAILQLATQFESSPYISAGSPHNFASDAISITNILSAPLTLSIQLLY